MDLEKIIKEAIKEVEATTPVEDAVYDIMQLINTTFGKMLPDWWNVDDVKYLKGSLNNILYRYFVK